MRTIYGARSDSNDAGLFLSMGMPADEIKKRIEAEPELFAVWPENWIALDVFIKLGTQWRIGMSGPTGLDYSVIPAVMRLAGVPPAQRNEVFEVVRQMESEALTHFAERTKKNGE